MKSALHLIGAVLELGGYLIVNTMITIHLSEQWIRDTLGQAGISSGGQAGMMFMLAMILISASAGCFTGVYRYIAIATVMLIAGHFVITTV